MEEVEKFSSSCCMDYDLVIIGAGPAGLAVVNSILKYTRCLVVDKGQMWQHRTRYSPDDNTSGVGGAGLFSDGKFSFFPSSTCLWQLDHWDVLLEAYNWTLGLIKNYLHNSMEFETPYPFVNEETPYRWDFKPYPSVYLDLESRQQLTNHLLNNAKPFDFHLQTEYLNSYFDKQTELFSITLKNLSTNQNYLVKSRFIVFASGRFAPLFMSQSQNTIFRRLEYGVRLVQNTQDSFIVKDTIRKNYIDPKYKFFSKNEIVEFRTFCTCKDGEVILSNTSGIWSVSGRADCPPTGATNFGFNTRILNPSLALKVQNELFESMKDRECHFGKPLSELLANPCCAYPIYGETLTQIMINGLNLLMEEFKIDQNKTWAVGPTLEGVGFYPNIDNSLRYLAFPAWACGDNSGIFRGIVAAMVSGYYVGKLFNKERFKNLH